MNRPHGSQPELKQKAYRGPLHGIPVGISDIIDVFDMPTGCGSNAGRTATPAAMRLAWNGWRQAGAIILGKTVTTAYASFDPSPTRNPWNLSRTPGGSSSRSAAAVACANVSGLTSHHKPVAPLHAPRATAACIV